ncbi:MAG TPA: type II methionyl aminopeptidase [archaeon]|nr:type II methionyl aminopeptidase [archaeon]
MDSEIIKNYKQAGVVWRSAINFAEKKCKEGKSLLELASEVEAHIKESGAGDAFPINLSINEEAAHFTPKYNDTYLLKESDVLKIDIGVQIEGYICDGATTVNLDNKFSKQIEANELALSNAISVAEYNKPIEKIGATIESTLKEKAFNPVYNLGGHGLGKYDIHAAPSIPNHSGGSSENLKGQAIAIEPFASNGKGKVSEAQTVEIFSLKKTYGVRNTSAREILKLCEKYQGLPFAERWLRKESKLSELNFTFGLRELMKAGCLEMHSGLKETKAIITQIEKSLLILEDKTIVLGE